MNKFNKSNRKGNVVIVLDGYDSAKILNISKIDPKEEWITDSSCSLHICYIKSWFETLKETDGSQVILGNNKTCKVIGKRTMRLRMYNGADKILQQINYIPGLKRKLISLNILDKAGYIIKTESSTLRISKVSQ